MVPSSPECSIPTLTDLTTSDKWCYANPGLFWRGQVLLGNRAPLALRIPENRHDLPNIAVLHQLKTVDAARKRFVPGRAPRFIGAEYVGDIPKRLDPPRHLRFVERVSLHAGARPRHVVLHRHHSARTTAA